MPARGRGNVRARGVAKRNINRAVRAARNAPLARIRTRPTVRGRGVSAAAINALRRFVMFPRKIKKDGSLGDKWWIEGLKWAGIVLMKVLATAVTAETLEQYLRQNPLPREHPLVGKLLTGSIPTGSIVRLAFGPEDFLGETDFVNASTSPATGHYRQARVEWVKIVICPTAHSNSRGGMIAACLTPLVEGQMADDFGSRTYETIDINELLKTPGVVYKSNLTPTTLQYSPRPSHYAFNWLQFGCQSAKTGLFGAGGDVCLYLDVALTNMASDDKDQEPNYNLASALLDISIEARVHLREYDEGVLVRTGPVALTNADKIGVFSTSKTTPVDIDDVYVHKHILLHQCDEEVLSLNSMALE